MNDTTQTSNNNCLALDHENNQCDKEIGHDGAHHVELSDTTFRLWIDDKEKADVEP